MICKMPFDLYKIYNSVRLLGGFVTVSFKHDGSILVHIHVHVHVASMYIIDF